MPEESTLETTAKKGRSKSQPVIFNQCKREVCYFPLSPGNRRRLSAPSGGSGRLFRVKSSMRVLSQAQSLSSTGIVLSSSESSFRYRPPIKKGVSFGQIRVREFDRTVVDNPSCSSGPPIGLDWTYYDTQPKSLEVYEHIHGQPRNQLDLIMSREERQTTLMLDWGVTYVEIAQAVRETFKVRNQRRRSVHNIGKAQKLDTFLESAQRKLKRTLLFQKRSSSQVQGMMQQAEEAAAFLAKVTAANNSDRMIEDPSAAAWDNDDTTNQNDDSDPHINQIRIAANSA